MKTARFRKFRPAFTLVELIVVITILAILATIGFLALSGYSRDAKSASVKTNARSVFSAIASESAVTWNSPRYYVIHDTSAALTGAVAYVDGHPVVLTGGNWNEAGSNYSAGNPDYAKLKMNPEKFKVSKLGPVFGEALAVYDAGSLSVGAMDATLASSSNGKTRSVSFFQVAGVSPDTKKASVVGNFPITGQPEISGLIRNPSDSGTGALVDDGTAGSVPPAPPAPTIVNVTGDDSSGRNWSDGTHAATCSWYLNAPTGKAYAGSVGDGTYWIDPDGAGGAAAFKAFCDMAGGGWIRVGYLSSLTFQQQFSGWDAWRFLASDYSLEFTSAQIAAIRAATAQGKQTYVHTCENVVAYYYTSWANYNYALGFKFQDGTTSPKALSSYSPVSVTLAQDVCKGNGAEGGTVANATIFNIVSKSLPVINVQTLDSGDTGEKFGSPLTSYPAYFR